MADPNETLLQVRVIPRGSRTCVELQRDGSLKVWVTSPPADGQANEAVVVAIAKTLSTAKSNLEIVRGHRGRDKVVRVAGLGPDEVSRRLAG